jgi:MoaA/NifB/PqqE/SkfB family radical SAM enzyme
MFITPENLNTINLEFTDYCNAACPMCARYKWNGELYKEKVNQNHNNLKTLQKRIPEKIIKQLKKFYSVGTYGDPLMNPECLDIFNWVKDINPDCELSFHTNGGGRGIDFWKRCAELGIKIRFGIDGLEDTNHLYRRNVNWQKLMENVIAFIQAGGKAHWHFYIFKHNEHQIEQARVLSKNLGFRSFSFEFSDRWKQSNWVTGELEDRSRWSAGNYFIEKPTTQQSTYYRNSTVKPYSEEQFNLTKKIVCAMASNNSYEIYVRANGNVQPCCMLGDLDVHESKNLIKDPKSVNINHTNLEDILNGEYFKLLDKGINLGTADRLKNCFYTCGVGN